MNRGVLRLTKGELEQIIRFIKLEKFEIAMQEDKVEYEIFVNEEDLESILDAVTPEGGNVDLESATEKIYNLLRSFA